MTTTIRPPFSGSSIARTLFQRARAQYFPPAPKPPASQFRLVSLRDEASAAPYVASWGALSSAALEPNPFLEPWCLLPALRLFGNSHTELALIIQAGSAAGKQSVVGVFPLQLLPTFRGSPVRAMRFWRHPHCFLCTPLIARGFDQQCWKTLFAYLAGRARLLEMSTLAGDGSVYESMLDYVNQHGLTMRIEQVYTRAMIELQDSSQSYLKSLNNTSAHREYAKKRRKLAEEGSLRFASIGPGDDVEPHLRDFMELEASGWKGRLGSALACSGTDREFFLGIARQAHQRKQLMLLSMSLNGRPIASQVNLYAGNGAFGFKIAFDEALAKRSPGMVLALELIEQMHRERRAHWLDTCSSNGSHPHKRLFGQRRTIVDLLCTTAPNRGQCLMALVPLIQYVRRLVNKPCQG